MLVVLLIVIVLMGVAYADMCLVSNTAHFGICYGKVAEDEERRAGKVIAAAEDVEEIAEVADVVPPAVFEAESAGEDRAIPESGTHTDDRAERIPARPQRSPAPAWLLLDLEPVLELRE
ncbi:MAG: hypothetical protein M8861_11465 [marine benthic group bacterium]|nr:hypothetical protein [Gemmatimonadota bacterium]